MRIDFYHLEQTPLERALPVIVDRAYQQGARILIKTSLAERSEYINSLLWTYDPGSFLPHGVEKDGWTDMQPVYITHKPDDHPNGATLLMIVDGDEVPTNGAFERVLYFFNGQDAEALAKARAEWKRIKESNGQLFYWKQDPTGRWEQKV